MAQTNFLPVKLGECPPGQATMAASVPVCIASNQSALPISGTITAVGDITVIQPTASSLKAQVELSQYTPAAGRLPVDGSGVTQPVSAAALPLPSGASTEATLALIKAKTDNLDVALSTRAVTGLTDGQLRASAVPVSAASLPLPSGASTEATLALIKAKTDNLDVALSTRAVTGLTDAQLRASAVPVSAASLPLPSGAATEATLALIKAKTDNLDVALSTRAVTGLTDAQLRASAVPVSAASLPLPTGAATETTLGNVLTTTAFQARVNTLGQKTMANSTPVVLSSDQTTFPVTATCSGTVTANQGTAAAHANRWPVGVSDGAAFISPATDRTTAAAPFAQRLSDGSAFYDAAKTGQLPAALVGARLDINNGAWLGSTAPSVGAKTSANSIPVVLASDQASVPVSATCSGTVTANPATYGGKTFTFVSVNQASAGTTSLAAADATKKHKLLGCTLVMSAAGSLKFSDGVADLSGPMDIAANGGFAVGVSLFPILETGATNRALQIVTTTGAARGYAVLLTEA